MRDPQKQAQACIIWMHGLGADASDMVSLAEQLLLEEVAIRHVFIDAPMRPVTLNGGMVMRAWYDIIGMDLADRVDKHGIEESELLVRKVMETQIKDGFDASQIFLAGFSQGGAMALHIALQTNSQLAGVIALSAYLPLGKLSQTHLEKHVPFFLASGQFDPLVLPVWTKQSNDWLWSQGYQNIAFHQYPMEHSICFEEIKDLSLWIAKQMQGVLQ